jgi:hypothetical protein
MPPSYVYALGRIEPRFPRLSVEKEFAQATGRADTVNLTDRQVLQRVLQQNRYLVKQLCWVMTVGGLETYIAMRPILRIHGDLLNEGRERTELLGGSLVIRDAANLPCRRSAWRVCVIVARVIGIGRALVSGLCGLSAPAITGRL